MKYDEIYDGRRASSSIESPTCRYFLKSEINSDRCARETTFKTFVILAVVKRGIAIFAAPFTDSLSPPSGLRLEYASQPAVYATMSNDQSFPLHALFAERFALATKIAGLRSRGVISSCRSHPCARNTSNCIFRSCPCSAGAKVHLCRIEWVRFLLKSSSR